MQPVQPDFTGVSSLISRGDPPALEELLRRYRPLLEALAREHEEPLLRSKVDRSDLVQQTCLDVVRGFEELRASNRIQFASWLKVLFFNNVRTLQRRFFLTEKRNVFSETALHDHLADPATSGLRVQPPVDELLSQERVERLHRVLGQLPPALQLVIKLRYEEGMSLKEIARHVDRSEDGVRMLLKRCLTSLRPEIFDDESQL